MPHLPIVKPTKIDLDPQKLQRAYDLLEEWTSGDDAPLVSGALLAGRHGKIAQPQFFGRQGPEPDAGPIRPDAMFLLASITKPLTYIAGMMMVERGLLSLGDLVTHYIPEFAAHHKEDVRVSHLFTHTSGLPDMLPDNLALRKAHAPLSKFIEGAILNTVPLFRAGTQLRYQSMGTLIVAELVQRLSGMTIHKFLRKEVFDPLGLKATGLGSKGLSRERLVRVVTPDDRSGDYGWNSPYWQELGAPWGGMFSSPTDFAVICQMMLQEGSYGGVRILSPDTVRRMTENRLHDYPDLPEPVRRTEGWGLGWQLNHNGTSGSWSDLLGRHVFGHTGATGTMAWIDRERDGFCLLFTTTPRSKEPWRLTHLSNAMAAAFV